MDSNIEISNRRKHTLFSASIVLSLRDPAWWMSRFLGMISRQSYLATSLMTIAGAVLVTASWWLGWMEAPLLQACAWMVTVSAGLIAIHQISLLPLKDFKIDCRLAQSFGLIDGDARATHIAELLNVEAESGIKPFGILFCRRLAGVQAR